MRILIVGSDYTWSIERFYKKHLNNLTDVQVGLFAAQNFLYSYLNKSILNKLKHRLKLTKIYKSINEKLKAEIVEFNPDLIWVFKGMEILPETLAWAKAKGIKLVNYNPDNPFIFTGRGSGNSNVKKSLDLYDFHFTYNLEILEQLRTGHEKYGSMLLPFAYELPEDLSIEKLRETEEINKVCFIGNPDKSRINFIKELLAKGISLDLYGNNWSKFLNHSNLTIKGPVYQNDLWVKLRCYRVQLNMLRVHNLNSHNMRTFEIPGVGGIQLAPYTLEHIQFFVPNENIFLYKNSEEAVSHINSLIQLDKEDADKIRMSAYDRCLKQGFSYKARANEVYSIFENLIK